MTQVKISIKALENLLGIKRNFQKFFGNTVSNSQIDGSL